MRYYNRHRLTRLLYSLFSVPCTLITAPAGFGKTRTAAAFLQRRRGVRHLWFRFHTGESEQNAWDRFVRESGLPGWPLPGSPIEAWPFLADISVRLRELTILALDNCDAIPPGRIDGLLACLLSALPEHLRVIVLARERPRFAEDALVFSERCLWIDGRDLAFTQAEAGDFFLVNRLPYREEIWEQTRGWPGLLCGYMDNLCAQPPDASAWLQRELIAPLAPGLRSAFLQLALPEEFAEDEAPALTQCRKAGWLVDRLVRDCLLERELGLCRMHPMVRAAAFDWLENDAGGRNGCFSPAKADPIPPLPVPRTLRQPPGRSGQPPRRPPDRPRAGGGLPL